MIECPDNDFGGRARTRLASDKIAWLTHVDGAGQPQASPVWFVWNDATGEVLLYTRPSANRLKYIDDEPRVSFVLPDDGAGHDFAVIAGRLRRSQPVPDAASNPEFVAKYGDWMADRFGTHQAYADMFSVPIILEAMRIRGHGTH